MVVICYDRNVFRFFLLVVFTLIFGGMVYAFYGIKEAFSPSTKPVFLTTEATTSTDAFAVAKEEAFNR